MNYYNTDTWTTKKLRKKMKEAIPKIVRKHFVK